MLELFLKIRSILELEQTELLAVGVALLRDANHRELCQLRLEPQTDSRDLLL